MPEFLVNLSWAALFQIVLIDILLGGDNAVVIALACRNLPPAQRTKGVLWGTAGAIVLRLILVIFAVALLGVPFLKMVGGVLLLWIGVKLMLPERSEHDKIKPADRLMTAIKTIIVADLVMSLDNVIAIAGAAQAAHDDHRNFLIAFGLVFSIPLIVWGSQIVLKLLDRFPVIVTAGAALLGWIAGGLIVHDVALQDWDVLDTDLAGYLAEAAGAAFVVVVGLLIKRRMLARSRRGLNFDADT